MESKNMASKREEDNRLYCPECRCEVQSSDSACPICQLEFEDMERGNEIYERYMKQKMKW
jgi:hypothetical protein